VLHTRPSKVVAVRKFVLTELTGAVCSRTGYPECRKWGVDLPVGRVSSEPVFSIIESER
jgi:hypothetical protein